jgi:hypothetical protein
MNVKVGQRWMFDAKCNAKYILEVLSISGPGKTECKVVQRFAGNNVVGSIDQWGTLPIDGSPSRWWTYLEGQDAEERNL